MTIIKKADGMVRRFMRFMNFEYLAWPPNIVYYLSKVPSAELLAHEEKHLDQYRRDGHVIYFIRWWWQFFTKGYQNIDYEVEALEAQNGKNK